MDSTTLGIAVALTMPLADTTLGAALSFFMKKQMSFHFQMGFPKERRLV